ncbi:Multidrug export protein MepA [Clostridium sp. N3C]|uniref:MATE family efflux transporter n=1 Tax=Clostridium sp. N3C TaxID=1776758 RepID=UPI00092DF004|nr:MATE family efflux transporter [Clostridium sp. N3C]NLZ34286.1 MATE family efflux transporter [Clostridiales bacterium]SCN21243.1 Multidrug export protein MepA [Clostridium sp. N3C]
MGKAIIKDFAKYVSLNILGMLGISCYILADTFFVSKALGATGITALNFSISIYSFIHGIGLMIGIGGATRYSILRSQNKALKANVVYTTCLKVGLFLGILLAIIGIFCSETLALLLGADSSTLPMTKTYLSTILCFSLFFIMNNVLIAFVRNDNNPNLAMIAMLTGSFCNIILDYIFMYLLKMGMFGAAFATCLAPIISIGILTVHYLKGKNNFKYTKNKLSLSISFDILRLGLSSFITEISSAVALITFNLVILRLEGNLGVASYGIVANIALVAVSVFTGIAQGIQPLISKAYGLKDSLVIKKLMKYAILTSVMIATLIYLVLFFNTDIIVGIFNSEKNREIAQIAKKGLRIYFIGFFFAGINICMSMYLSATEKARDSFIVSVGRGCVIIVPLVLILSALLKMTGIWLSFVLTEFIVNIISIIMINFQRGVSNKDKIISRAS